jgi:hypothetical protein
MSLRPCSSSYPDKLLRSYCQLKIRRRLRNPRSKFLYTCWYVHFHFLLSGFSIIKWRSRIIWDNDANVSKRNNKVPTPQEIPDAKLTVNLEADYYKSLGVTKDVSEHAIYKGFVSKCMCYTSITMLRTNFLSPVAFYIGS